MKASEKNNILIEVKGPYFPIKERIIGGTI